MKKIMFYTLTMCSGGAERVIANLANTFAKRNNVAISTLLSAKTDYELNSNISFFSSTDDDRSNFLARFKACYRLLKITLKYKPDTIIAFCPTMCFLACFFKIFIIKFKKIKLIISERNDPNSEYKNSFLKFFANFLYSRADVIVFQTSNAKIFFNNKVQKKGVIIPNPINEKFLTCNIDVNKENSIINVGRYEVQKNHELLIKACAHVFSKYTDWKLKIYGEGSLKAQLNELIKKLKMENNIFLYDRCDNLENILPQNKIFVLSSLHEGMPNALMEAMACGLACISTDCPCGGPKDLLSNTPNILVKNNNIDQLEQAIISMINNIKNVDYKLINRKHIQCKYDNFKILSQWKKII